MRKKLKLSRRVATIWVVISLFVAVFIGVIGYTMSKVGALEMLTGSNSETIIVKISALLSQHGVIFALLAGVILAGIFSFPPCPLRTRSCWLHLLRFLPTFSVLSAKILPTKQEAWQPQELHSL